MISNPPEYQDRHCVASDWSAAKPHTLAKPTWSPAALAFGVTLTAWGLIASAIVLAVGVAVVILSLSVWIGEIADEHAKH